MQVYSLTGLTRNANAQRRVVIQGFDLPARGLLIASLAFVPSLIITAIFWIFVGEYALVMIPLVEIGVFWLIEGRTRSGLKLRNYQTFYDKKRSSVGTFFVCGHPVDFRHGRAVTLVSSSLPGTLAEPGGSSAEWEGFVPPEETIRSIPQQPEEPSMDRPRGAALSGVDRWIEKLGIEDRARSLLTALDTRRSNSLGSVGTGTPANTVIPVGADSWSPLQTGLDGTTTSGKWDDDGEW
jgi:hypothetical protein